MVLGKNTKAIADKRLAEYFDTGYGIFGGDQSQWAEFKFNSLAARYVEEEMWHVEQRSRTDNNGNYVLEVPFVQSNELIMDVLRHGPDVVVIGPACLRQEMAKRVTAMLKIMWLR